jgi:hypothetical protein
MGDAQNRRTAEEIIGKLREVEIRVARGAKPNPDGRRSRHPDRRRRAAPLRSAGRDDPTGRTDWRNNESRPRTRRDEADDRQSRDGNLIDRVTTRTVVVYPTVIFYLVK